MVLIVRYVRCHDMSFWTASACCSSCGERVESIDKKSCDNSVLLSCAPRLEMESEMATKTWQEFLVQLLLIPTISTDCFYGSASVMVRLYPWKQSMDGFHGFVT